mgnify:FL=1
MSDPVVTMLKDIVANLSPADDEWRSMSMVIGFDGDFLNRTFGYTYSPDGVATSVSADPFAIAASTEDYLANTYEPGAPRPVRFLVQLANTE